MRRGYFPNSLPRWAETTILRIYQLGGDTPDDVQKRRLARNIVRFCEIDAPDFPAARVTRDKGGMIAMGWANENSPLGPCRLDIQISRPHSFRGVIWFPGAVADVVVANRDHIQHARRLFVAFWPEAGGHSVEDMMELTRVERGERR